MKAGPVERVGRRPRRLAVATMAATIRRRAAPVLVTVAVALPLLAACGRSEPAAPTAPPATVADATTIVDDSATSGDPDIGGPIERASPAASPGADGAAGTALILGALADRIDTAWLGVRSYREVFVTDAAAVTTTGAATPSPVAATPVASPRAETAALEVTLEVVVPDRKRMVIRTAGDIPSEAVTVAGRIYVRGPLSRLVRPDADPGDWIEIDPTTLAPHTPLGDALAGLTLPVASPTAAIPANLRAQEVRPLGPVDVAGRSCEAFGAAATTETGTRIDLTIAVDQDDLPCFIETRSAGVVGRVTYEAFNEPFAIEAPADALPIGSPVTAATPLGRD